MNRLTRFACAALGASFVVVALPAQEETGGFGVPKQTTIEVLRSNAQAFKNVWVEFTGQFMGLGAVHNPFFTRFTRSEYVNFAVWGEKQRLWERSEYDNPCSTLFCSKGDGDLLTQVYQLQRYDRVKIRGAVRNDFQGEPWVEVTSIEPVEGRVTTATITHLARANGLIQSHRWQQAAIELNLAASQSLTAVARGWLHSYLGLCLMRLGRPQEAMTQLRAGRELLPDEHQVGDWLAQVEADPRSQVDQQVNVSQVRKGDRPMWEGVEEEQDSRRRARPSQSPGASPARPEPQPPSSPDEAPSSATPQK